MKAHELLADKTKWTQNMYARDEAGSGCPIMDEHAACWCAMGAIKKCYYDEGSVHSNLKKANEVALRKHGIHLEAVNDTLGYDAALNVLREADV